MVYFIKRTKTDGSKAAYITEDKLVLSKLTRGEEPINIDEISIEESIAYFEVELAEKGVKISKHPQYNALEVSDVSALDNYVKKALSMLKLDPFHPERVQWEEQRKENLQGLTELIVKHYKK